MGSQSGDQCGLRSAARLAASSSSGNALRSHAPTSAISPCASAMSIAAMISAPTASPGVIAPSATFAFNVAVSQSALRFDVIGSWGDTLDDADVLELLRMWNETGDIRLS
jgi:hypothetical protein